MVDNVERNSVNDWWAQRCVQRKQEQEAGKQTLFAALRTFPDIVGISVSYSGSGDSGSVDDVDFETIENKPLPASEELERLREMADAFAWSAVPLGFWNDEGGSGSVHIDVGSKSATVEHTQYVAEYEEYSV